MEYRKEWTPTQIAANAAFHTRRKARRRGQDKRGFTQDEAVIELARLGCVGPTGKPWKKANLSALEAQRLPRETRHRAIDADTIMAMSYAYDVSPLSFFIPPDEAETVVIGDEKRSAVEVRAVVCGLLALFDIRIATAKYGGAQIAKEMEEKLLAVYGVTEEEVS